MKRYFMIVMTALMMIASQAHGQATLGTDFRGTSILGGGFYVGYYGYGFTGNRHLSVPPITAYYEYGVHEYITIGPSVGYARWNYRQAGVFNYSWSFIHAGARGSFHLTPLINEVLGDSFDAETFDIYGAIVSGVELRNFSYGDFGPRYDNEWRLFFGPILGFRYYLSPRLALFVEGGRGALGVVTVGISTRF